MSFKYDDQQWDVWQTIDDTNSLFHAVFGEKKEGEQSYSDRRARSHRMNLANFLRYYETRPRPQRLTDALKRCFDELGCSVETDNDFKTYIKEVENDRPVRPDEIVILATLENVNVILFRDLQTSPEEIRPVTEILERYPFTNQNQLSTAVVFFNGTAYSKLIPKSAEIVNEETKDTFRRFPGYIAGILYEINLLTIVLLNAFEKHDTWRMSANNVDASYFDDVILEWGLTNETFLLQAKRRQKKVYFGDLFGNKYSGFSLCKYFFAYEKVKCNYKVNNVVLCTNVEIQLQSLAEHLNVRRLREGDLLYLEGVTGICVTFKEGFAQVLLEKLKYYGCEPDQRHQITEENVTAFLKDLQLVRLPLKEKVLERAIENKIISMGLAGKYEGTDYARHLNKKITEWYDKSSRYFTPLEAKVIFCGLKSDKTAERLNRLEIDFKPDKLDLSTVKRVLHLIPQNDNVLTLLKSSKFLENGGFPALFLSTAESPRNQRLISEAFESPEYTYLVVYIPKAVQEVRELCDRIVRALNKFEDKRVILIGDRNDRLAEQLRTYNEEAFEAVEDSISFTDFSEKSQEELLEKAILFREASL